MHLRVVGVLARLVRTQAAADHGGPLVGGQAAAELVGHAQRVSARGSEEDTGCAVGGVDAERVGRRDRGGGGGVNEFRVHGCSPEVLYRVDGLGKAVAGSAASTRLALQPAVATSE